MMRPRWWRLALVGLALHAATAGAASQGTAIRGVDGLIRAYDVILDARFDQVDEELRRACGPAPPEACDVLAATAIWWQILLDPQNRSLDDEFRDAVEHAIDTTEEWTDRSPDDAEAWFYHGAAYAARVQWRVLRNEKVSAARDGKRIKDAMERAIALDATLEDAHFGVGMYKYYADVAPTAAKILRFLLLLPGGDRKAGLAEMLRARTHGRLLQGEADYQLHVIYLWYERQTPRALQLLQSLHDRYPANPLFIAQTAEIEDIYQHDVTASLATWRSLLAAARDQRVNAPALSETQARLGIARQLEILQLTDDAIETLQGVIAARPSAPFGSFALAQLRLGEAYDRLGVRAAAVDSYRAAAAAAPTPDVYGIASAASDHLRRAPDAKRAEAYRLSLEGWRRLEHNDVTAAAAALDASLALNGSDAVAHYRAGRGQQARKNDAAALAHYEQAIKAARTCPPPILGYTYVDAARILERHGRRTQAISYYRFAASLFGAASHTRAAATRALTRLKVVDR
jgi:tetratricopeptide (TPR) repeat protein